jgi:hypothetical protein
MKMPRLGASCGVLFAVGLFVAVGDGSQGYSAGRVGAAVVALTLAVPFLACVAGLLRAAEGPDGWLGGAALAAGATGIALKLGSGAPEVAVHQAHLRSGTPPYDAVTRLGDAATVLSLLPLAVFCAATAIVAFRTRALPRWLAAFAAVTAAALAANGSLVGTGSVPAMVLFLLWTLVTSGYLMVRPGGGRAVPAGEVATVAVG